MQQNLFQMMKMMARRGTECFIAALAVSLFIGVLPISENIASAQVQLTDEHFVEQPISRIAFGSCAKESSPQPIWAQVRAYDPELFIWAGDNVYNDTINHDEMRAKWAMLDDKPIYRDLRQQIPMLATWDDHDYGFNDSGAEFPEREASQQIFLDWLGVAADSPRREREGIYHSEIVGPPGQRVQFIVLDTRYHRSALVRYEPAPGERRSPYKPLNDRNATMLGEAQWNWLEEQLQKPAEIRLIVTSIQFVSDEHRFEKWGNLPRERYRMLDMIRRTQARGVIFLSGDRHHAELSKLQLSDLYPLYDLTASGLTQSRPSRNGDTRPPELNRHRIDNQFRGHHFGAITIDWEQPDPAITLEIVDREMATPIAKTIHLSELQHISPPWRMEEDIANGVIEWDVDGPPITPIAWEAESTEPETIVVDGCWDDWDQSSMIVADDDYLYIRLMTAEEVTLRRSTATTILAIDLDNDRATGSGAALTKGSEIQIEVNSPRESDGRFRLHPRVKLLNEAGLAQEINEGAIGLHVMPTQASRTFEYRLNRYDLPAEIDAYLKGSGIVRAVGFSRHLETGEVTKLLEAEAKIAAAAPRSKQAKLVTIPEKDADSLRVVTLNTLWASQLETPEPFARVFDAIDADVYLVQEWGRDRFTETEIITWFKQHVDADVDWQAMVTGSGGRGSGTAIVSAYPMIAKVSPYSPVTGDRWSFPARIAIAGVDAPQGRYLFGNVHFKASGYFESPEDVRRLAEAEAVNRLLTGMMGGVNPDVVVLGGDYNLVGTDKVVDIATRNLDLDGSALKLAHPTVLGHPTLVYTHGQGDSKNRLDYIAYSEAGAEITAGFVLDSTVLNTASLKALGLQPQDSHASDHLPVVVDLKPRRKLER